MGSIHRFSNQLIDYAERLSDVADAAQGKRRRRGAAMRWLALPASGAAVYAFVRSKSFSRQAKEVVDEAKSRASELPNDLISRVRQAASSEASGGSTSGGQSTNGSQARRTSGGTRKSTSSARSRSSRSRSSASRSKSSSSSSSR